MMFRRGSRRPRLTQASRALLARAGRAVARAVGARRAEPLPHAPTAPAASAWSGLEALESRRLLAADIDLLGGATWTAVIPRNDTSPSLLDHTDFGNVELGGASTSWTFRILNRGNAALHLTGAKVTLSGANAADFSVVSQPASPVPASPGTQQDPNYRDFTLSFNPSLLGAHTATVTVTSDDPDEASFSFAIKGTGIAARLSGAVEDQDFTIAYADLWAATHETALPGTPPRYRIESIQSGTLTVNGVAAKAGQTVLGSNDNVVWRPAPNANRTQAAFTLKQWTGTAVTGGAIPVRIEVAPQADDISGTIADQVLTAGTPRVIDLLATFRDPDVTGSAARFDTPLGSFYVALFDQRTPRTVASFLKYVSDGDYVNSWFHRLIPGFVAQGGGYRTTGASGDPAQALSVPTDPPVVNEPGIASLRGTVAMAKVGNNPDSATSQWFFNLDDNSQNLDNQNGGFTVFGEVVGGDMSVLDAIEAVETWNAGGDFANLPLIDYPGGGNILNQHLVLIPAITRVQALSFEVVGNTNPGLVTAAIANGKLTLTAAAGQAGKSTVTLRVRDLGGETRDVVFVAAVTTVSVTVADAAAGETTPPAGANPARFTIARTGPTTAPLDVTFALTGTAGQGADYTLTLGTTGTVLSDHVTIPAGAASVTINVNPVNDALVEGLESLALTLTAGAGYRIDPARGQGQASLTDNDLPLLTAAVQGPAASESGPGAGILRISRTGEASGTLTFSFTRSGTATNTTDYTLTLDNHLDPVSALAATLNSVTMPAGQAFVDIIVTPVDDARAETAETVILTLATSSAYTLEAPTRAATLNILDNEPVVSIARLDHAGEGLPPAAFRISRSNNTAGNLTVPLARGGTGSFGSTGDYTLSVNGANLTATSVVIPAGEDHVDLLVHPVDDARAEATETVILTLGTSTAYTLDAGAKAATMNILDNEPVVRIDRIADAAEAGGSGLFRITRTLNTSGALAVAFARSGSATFSPTGDYTLSVGGATLAATTVTLPDGQASVDIAVLPVDNLTAEATETVVLTLSTATAYTLDAAARAATLSIVDNEPLLSVARLSDAVEGGASGAFRISRSDSNAVVLRDDFSGGALDSSRWFLPSGAGTFLGRTQLRAPGAGGSPTLTGGVARLRFDTFNPTNLPGNPSFYGTEIVSRQTYDLRQGLVIEARVRVPDGAPGGLVASVFAYGASGAQRDEIDFELLTNDIVGGQPRVLTNVYDKDNWTPAGNAEFTPIDALDLTEFNTFTIEYLPDRVRWSVNGQLVREVTTSLPSDPVTVRLNFWAPDAGWTDAYDAALTPSLTSAGNRSWYYEIDYVEVRRPSGFGGALPVSFTRSGTAAGSDYTLKVEGATLSSNTVTIPDDQPYVDVQVAPVNDATAEPTETVVLTLGSGSAYHVDANARSATVQIADNEPVISIAKLGDTGEGLAPGTFRLTRSVNTTGTLTVSFTRSGTAGLGATQDFTLSVAGQNLTASSVVFADGQDTLDILVAPVDNAAAEAAETVALTLSNGTAYTVDAQARTATMNLLDNEPVVSVARIDHAAEGGVTGAFRISRTTTTGNLAVGFSTSGSAGRGASSDYVLQLGGTTLTVNSVTIPDGQDFVDLIVAPRDDTNREQAETVVLTLAANAAYSLDPIAANRAGTLQIVDND